MHIRLHFLSWDVGHGLLCRRLKFCGMPENWKRCSKRCWSGVLQVAETAMQKPSRAGGSRKSTQAWGYVLCPCCFSSSRQIVLMSHASTSIFSQPFLHAKFRMQFLVHEWMNEIAKCRVFRHSDHVTHCIANYKPPSSSLQWSEKLQKSPNPTSVLFPELFSWTVVVI